MNRALLSSDVEICGKLGVGPATLAEVRRTSRLEVRIQGEEYRVADPDDRLSYEDRLVHAAPTGNPWTALPAVAPGRR